HQSDTFSINSDDENTFRANIKQALRNIVTIRCTHTVPSALRRSGIENKQAWYKRRCCSLIPAKSDSSPHAYAQITKTYYKHQDSRIKKAQELKIKTSANSDIQDLPLIYQVYQGRLLASFLDDENEVILGSYKWVLKNPWPPWVKAKIRTENVNNVKFYCMIGQFNKEQAYLDLESLINIMSRLHYNWIMSNRLEPRRKPSNPKKNCNFIGRVKGLRVFVGNFTYECEFMMVEDTTSVIDHYLGSMVFEKPFVEATGLVYNKEEGMVVFKRVKERIIFKMPHRMDMFKHVDFTNRGTYSIPPFVIESDDDNCEKTHYSNSLDLGPEYKYVCRGIQRLIAVKSRRKNKGEVT
nr:protein kinase-like domain, concanavalin A-like lectin/glucanase domain protein [Tanacetum cinerariifolium]